MLLFLKKENNVNFSIMVNNGRNFAKNEVKEVPHISFNNLESFLKIDIA